ncbi:alpha/beta fold hydrolase [Alteribacillus iranensis]|nr:alpha/beta hydrolase [Alteribacillus iranensis]
MTSQGATIHYQTWGSGFPIIFIHPPSMGAATFMEQKELSDEFQVICMDARGHRLSSNGKGTLTIQEWAVDIYHLVEELNQEKVILAGYSSGGSVALEFALRWPERTAGIILTGGFPEVCSTLLKKEFEIGIWFAENNHTTWLAHILSFSNSRRREHRKAIAQTVSTIRPRLLQSLYESGMTYSCTNRLSELKVPLLLIYGTRDWYVHYYQYLFYKYAVHAPKEVIYVDSVGHQVPTLEAHTYNAVVRRFARDTLSHVKNM